MKKGDYYIARNGWLCQCMGKTLLGGHFVLIAGRFGAKFEVISGAVSANGQYYTSSSGNGLDYSHKASFFDKLMRPRSWYALSAIK